MIEKVFYDQELDSQLFNQGYVKINFLNEDQQKRLGEFYQLTHQQHEAPFTTFMSDDFKYKRAVDIKIKEIFEPSLSGVFRRHVPFWGNFFSKQSGSSQMPLHSDLQYTDETEDLSLNIWTSLSKTNKRNATLGIVPKSHKLMHQHRGINIIAAYDKNADAIADKFVQYVDFEPGEAIIYDHRLLHLSSKNESEEIRIAATLVMVPNDKPVQMYFAEQEGDTTFFLYQIDRVEDLIRTPFKKLPNHLSPIKTIENYQFKPLTIEEVQMIATPTA